MVTIQTLNMQPPYFLWHVYNLWDPHARHIHSNVTSFTLQSSPEAARCVHFGLCQTLGIWGLALSATKMRWSQTSRWSKWWSPFCDRHLLARVRPMQGVVALILLFEMSTLNLLPQSYCTSSQFMNKMGCALHRIIDNKTIIHGTRNVKIRKQRSKSKPWILPTWTDAQNNCMRFQISKKSKNRRRKDPKIQGIQMVLCEEMRECQWFGIGGHVHRPHLAHWSGGRVGFQTRKKLISTNRPRCIPRRPEWKSNKSNKRKRNSVS